MSSMFASKFEVLLVDISNSKSKMSLSKFGHSDEALNDDFPGDSLISHDIKLAGESLQHASLTFRKVDRERSDRLRNTLSPDKRCWYGESELESKVANHIHLRLFDLNDRLYSMVTTMKAHRYVLLFALELYHVELESFRKILQCRGHFPGNLDSLTKRLDRLTLVLGISQNLNSLTEPGMDFA